jgi:Chaperone for flagella basal body P-ring formation
VGALLLATCSSAQMDGRTALEREAAVTENIVRLSDLLPGAAPPELRSQAQEIVLGDAPLPGDRREFTREEILSALHGDPALRSELEIPPQIELRRSAQRITRGQVLAAIDRMLRANGSSAADTLLPGDLELSADVAVSENNPKLQVTQIQRGANGAGSRVLVWVISEPRVPPFWVRLDRSIDLDARAQTRDQVAVAPVGLPQRSASAIVPVSERTPIVQRKLRLLGSILVKAGAPVELVVQVGGMTIQGTGIPLDPGREGDEVRVRAAESGKILVGTVVGQQTVQVRF